MSWSGPDALLGLRFFKRHSIPYEGHVSIWVSLEGLVDTSIMEILPGFFFCAMALSEMGDIGLNTDWHCWLRALALPMSEVNVRPLALSFCLAWSV